ncbi:hypothetical protein AWZ03_011611 [Drosophila navojoa]|uniref:L-seryl-tRNA(Sec) kinase n=1 Tax=Drosophila navojoa TaxID=7232 RepID=A0A484B2E4_DRONA|nr:L-seryl-tRNA(Sec) kinase [Drosophila navojoa]TDG41965.1 hypothetical protein AWZ03_011611 [Drosophila navojoa]
MPRICLLALIGLPGAGKTTLSKWLMQQQPDLLAGWHLLHLCYDDYFDIQPTNKIEYKEQRQFIYNLLEQLIVALQAGKADLPGQVRESATTTGNSNHLIICDDNHYYRSMRYKLYQLSRNQNCLYAQLHLASSLDDALLANEKRGANGALPPAVVQQMGTRLEPPSETLAWEQLTLTLNSTIDFNAVAEEIHNFLQTLLNSPLIVTPAQQEKQPQLQSLTHQLDLKLRARIQNQMKSNKVEEMQQQPELRLRSLALNEQRKQILAQFRFDMRSGQMEFSNDKLEYYVNMLK